MDHKYTVDTVITMSLGIGISNARHDDEIKLGDLMDQEEIDKASEEEIEKAIEEVVNEWSYNYIDTGWSVKDES
jgi:hypothetical protein